MVEKCQYSLTLQGSPVGNYAVLTHKSKKGIFLESHLVLQGSLGKQAITQYSCLHSSDLYSLSFREETLDHNQHRSWAVSFDSINGLVTASRNKDDVVAVPYILPFQDPLGLLYQIRKLKNDLPMQIAMLGKNVLVNLVKIGQFSTALGKREARVYILHPGGSYVYVDTKAPHYILKLTQKLQHQFVESSLVKVIEEKGNLKQNSSSKTSLSKANFERQKHQKKKPRATSKHRKQSKQSSKK